MSVDDLASEEALLGDLTHAESNDLDLYGDNDANFDQLDSNGLDTSKLQHHSRTNENSNGSSGDPNNLMDHVIKLDENDDDLYNAVITERSSPTSGDHHNNSGNNNSVSSSSATSTQHHITGSGTLQRKHSCYIGNLTWWTTDQDLVDTVVTAGITDLIDVKFYENRQNGQSKGFALVSFNSEPSIRQCMERLVGKQIHGQQLVVLPYTKHSLAQFEAATRKPGERTQQSSNQSGSTSPTTAATLKAAGLPEPGKPGGPVFIGTFRIGMAQGPPPPAQSAPPPSMPPPPPTSMSMHAPPPPHHHQQHHPQFMRGPPTSGPPPPGAILIRPGPPPPNAIIQQSPVIGAARPPPGMGPGPQLMLPPPQGLPSRPPPNFAQPQPVRITGPPPFLPHGLPPPGSHVNPNFYPSLAAAAQQQQGGASSMMPQNNLPPPQQQQQQQQQPPNAAGGMVVSGAGAQGGGAANEPPLTEAEFEEIMNRNRTVSSSAISRAVSDASAGDFASAIETLVTAISLIRQSKVSHDDRCKILISSLQDTLRGIEAKSFGGAGAGSGGVGNRRASKERDRRSRSRDRGKRRRERSPRSRSRSRERFEDYSPRRRRY